MHVSFLLEATMKISDESRCNKNAASPYTRDNEEHGPRRETLFFLNHFCFTFVEQEKILNHFYP